MSESTRALCQIIEARPFLTLTDEELSLLAYLMERHAIALNDSVSTVLFNRLRNEVASRRAFERGLRSAYDQADAALRAIQTGLSLDRTLREGRWPEPERCESTRTFSGEERQPLVPTRCEGIRGHDGPHFVGHHATRTEW